MRGTWATVCYKGNYWLHELDIVPDLLHGRLLFTKEFIVYKGNYCLYELDVGPDLLHSANFSLR
jgi:hypothetical protein